MARWEPSFRALLDRLSDHFRELREGVQKAIRIADEDPEMALTRARKVLEHVIRDVYQRRCNEPPGSRPLENLIQRLVKDGHFPDRLDAYAATVRKLGNVGTHTFGEKIAAADVYQSLTQLTPILEWYFEVERPEAAGAQRRSEQRRPTPRPIEGTAPFRVSNPGSPSSRRACGPSTPRMLISSSTFSQGHATRTACPRASASGSTASRRRKSLHSRWASSTDQRDAASRLWSRPGCCPSFADRIVSGLRRGDGRRHRGPVARGVAAALPRSARRPRSDRSHRRSATGVRPDAARPEKKSFIVLDQFEQWLHANRRGVDNPELAQGEFGSAMASRCSAVVLVRDDFWLTLSRFMNDLHIELVQGRNCSPWSICSTRTHARKVLAAFGQAFGRAARRADEGAGIVPRSSGPGVCLRTAG